MRLVTVSEYSNHRDQNEEVKQVEKFKVVWIGSPNYTPGRAGRKPIAIVNHITAGLNPGALQWLQNPKARVSVHYLVSKKGEIFQLVKEEDTAWANGAVNQPHWPLYDGSNPNYYTLSIEHEALAGEGLTDRQYQASLWLHQQLINRWGIPIHADFIIGHYRIDSVNRKNCPGLNFPWDSLFADLRKTGENIPAWKQDIMIRARQAGLITGQHHPDERADKWFVLEVALRVQKIK